MKLVQCETARPLVQLSSGIESPTLRRYASMVDAADVSLRSAIVALDDIEPRDSARALVDALDAAAATAAAALPPSFVQESAANRSRMAMSSPAVSITAPTPDSSLPPQNATPAAQRESAHRGSQSDPASAVTTAYTPHTPAAPGAQPKTSHPSSSTLASSNAIARTGIASRSAASTGWFNALASQLNAMTTAVDTLSNSPSRITITSAQAASAVTPRNARHRDVARMATFQNTSMPDGAASQNGIESATSRMPIVIRFAPEPHPEQSDAPARSRSVSGSRSRAASSVPSTHASADSNASEHLARSRSPSWVSELSRQIGSLSASVDAIVQREGPALSSPPPDVRRLSSTQLRAGQGRRNSGETNAQPSSGQGPMRLADISDQSHAAAVALVPAAMVSSRSASFASPTFRAALEPPIHGSNPAQPPPNRVVASNAGEARTEQKTAATNVPPITPPSVAPPVVVPAASAIGRLRQQLDVVLPQMVASDTRLQASIAEFGSVDVGNSGIQRWESASLPARKAIEAAKRSGELARRMLQACEAAHEIDEGEAGALQQQLVAAFADSSARTQEAVTAVEALLVQHLSEAADVLRAGSSALAHIDASLESTKHVYNRLDLALLPADIVAYPQSGNKQPPETRTSSLDQSLPSSQEAITAVLSASSALTSCDESRRSVDPSAGKESAALILYAQTVESASAAVRRAEAALVEVGLIAPPKSVLAFIHVFFVSLFSGCEAQCSCISIETAP